MKKDIKDYLHLYPECEVLVTSDERLPFLDKVEAIVFGESANLKKTGDYYFDGDNEFEIQIALRPLSDMTEEEAEHFAWMVMNTRHHPEHTPVDKDEIQIELTKNDGGNLLDNNIEVYIGISCRCWEGWVAFYKDGAILLREEDSDRNEPIDDIAEKIQYLLSKHFDIFGLKEAGLVIDKTILK